MNKNRDTIYWNIPFFSAKSLSINFYMHISLSLSFRNWQLLLRKIRGMQCTQNISQTLMQTEIYL